MIRQGQFLWRRELQHHFPVDGCQPPRERSQIALAELKDHDVLRLHTETSDYQIRVLRIGSRDVLIRGGKAFADWTHVQLEGAVNNEDSASGPGIFTGHPVALLFRNQRVLTGPVRAMEVVR